MYAELPDFRYNLSPKAQRFKVRRQQSSKSVRRTRRTPGFESRPPHFLCHREPETASVLLPPVLPVHSGKIPKVSVLELRGRLQEMVSGVISINCLALSIEK